MISPVNVKLAPNVIVGATDRCDDRPHTASPGNELTAVDALWIANLGDAVDGSYTSNFTTSSRPAK